MKSITKKRDPAKNLKSKFPTLINQIEHMKNMFSTHVNSLKKNTITKKGVPKKIYAESEIMPIKVQIEKRSRNPQVIINRTVDRTNTNIFITSKTSLISGTPKNKISR